MREELFNDLLKSTEEMVKMEKFQFVAQVDNPPSISVLEHGTTINARLGGNDR